MGLSLAEIKELDAYTKGDYLAVYNVIDAEDKMNMAKMMGAGSMRGKRL